MDFGHRWMRFLIWKINGPIGHGWIMIEVFFYVCNCFHDAWTRLDGTSCAYSVERSVVGSTGYTRIPDF